MKLVFASHNQNKIKEIKLILPFTFEILSLADINCHKEIEETGSTIEENAQIKAQFIYDNYGLNCFADDSGLEVDALHGEPGVFSARYAGNEKDDDKNIDKLLGNLKNKTNKKANFKTVICLIINGEKHLFSGIIKGKIIDKKIGTNGFGYDSVFVADGFTKTFAELSLTEKSKISHRAIAVKNLIEFLKNY